MLSACASIPIRPGSSTLNVPAFSDEPLPGVQHKYPETVLVFPKQGQTCHAYCTYCFRWAQFVGEPDLKMATDDMSRVSLLPALAATRSRASSSPAATR